jgi:GntR family transcriptional regulator/MocR family aminotransferase
VAKWAWKIAIDESDSTPLFARLARAIAADIRRGRLAPGARLPGSRALSAELHIHRNTVLAAYDELRAEGLLSSEPGRSTFVASVLPTQLAAPAPAPAVTRDAMGFDLLALDGPWPPPDPSRDVLMLEGGRPDPTLAPVKPIFRAYRRVLQRSGHQVLEYARGETPSLRRALEQMLVETRGIAMAGRAMLVTSGSQMAIFLVALALVRPGDAVAVEDPGYSRAWLALRQLGAEIVPIAVDHEGLRVDLLERALATRRIRAVYVTPHHQFPTTVSLVAERRRRLLDLAARHRFAIVEDDFDPEYQYDGKPILPIASDDRRGSVLYVGTLSKVLAPGIRIGYAVGPAPLIERMAKLRDILDIHGDMPTESAVGELLEEGELQRHVWRTVAVYRRRRDALAELLRAHLGSAVGFDVPTGGLAMWLRVDPAIDIERWLDVATGEGVHFQTGQRYFIDAKPAPFVRLGFAYHDDDTLALGVRRMAKALVKTVGKRTRRSSDT